VLLSPQKTANARDEQATQASFVFSLAR